jgi:hypothetical protein
MVKISVITPSIRPKGLEITQKCLKEQSFTDFEWHVELGLGTKHDFNQAMNRMIRRSTGELIVILQDYIKIEPDALQKCWDLYQNNKQAFVTFPVGKSKTLEFDNPQWDWRKSPDSEMDWQKWEIDFGMCSKEALYNIGGFDEELDRYWSFDNVNVGYRAFLAGYFFLKDITNCAIAYDHDSFIEHPFRKNYNPTFHNNRLSQFESGKKIDFLNSY